MIYILGAGGMARETLDIYKFSKSNNNVLGFIEENCKRVNSKIHDKIVFDASIIDNLPKDSIFIGAIGSSKRKRWIEEIKQKGFDFDTLIHPLAIIGTNVSIDEGSIICATVVLTCDIKIGKHSIINVNTTVNHDCVIGDFVTICPSVNIAGNVTIANNCWVGIGATIINGISIGSGSFIGAGAVVTKDIPDNVLAVGVPAKPVRLIHGSD